MENRPFHSTPPKPTSRGFIQYSTNPFPLAKERRERLRKNMEGYYLGPMDPTQFMSSFMPVNSQNIGSPPDGIDFSEVYKQGHERSMYNPFIEIMNGLCTNYVVKFTGDRSDAKASLKPDVTLFSKNDKPNEVPDAETSFFHIQLFVELKREAQYDPFVDLVGGRMEERNTLNGNATRGKCLLYATNQLAYQHRLFAFSLVICGKVARFIRWDREGLVVSASIDCSERSDLVVEFLWRFNQLTHEQRGLDPTATPATPEQVEKFRSAVVKIEIGSLKFSVGHQDICPRFRIEVRNPDNTVSYYIVGKALDYNLGIIGRCTRGYLALDLSTNECVFLKDMWRPDVTGVEPEHVWYEKLIEAKVPHLVKFKHGSDVVPSTPPVHYHGTIALEPTTTTGQQGAQLGLTSRLACLFESPDPLLQGHVHYRLVQGELCRPLPQFKNSKHLTLVVLHSLKACSSAQSDANLFHRDASLGNIMIAIDGEGRLNDWDLCRGIDVDQSLEGPRTGTWQFMSTRLLEIPGSKHTITDDLESHFFVLMWTALHWVEHNLSDPLSIDMELIFDHQRPAANGSIKGGAGKGQMYMTRRTLGNVEFSCKPFHELFWDLWLLFATYFKERSRVELEGGSEPFVSPQKVIDLFEAALKKPGWVDDKVLDQFPRAGGKRGPAKPPLGSDNGANHDQNKKRQLTKSLAEVPAKRRKVNELYN